MNHIKPYKLFESAFADFMNTLNDICIDLKDDGFEFNVNFADELGLKAYNKRDVIIEIFLPNRNQFHYTSVSEVVDRIGKFVDDSLEEAPIPHGQKYPLSEPKYKRYYTQKNPKWVNEPRHTLQFIYKNDIPSYVEKVLIRIINPYALLK